MKYNEKYFDFFQHIESLNMVVFKGLVHQTGKRPQLNWTELQKTGPSVAVWASQDGRTAPN
jgi:hypothetical protein